jgi:hypothetical protein
MPRWSEVCACCVSGGIPKRSLFVALVVGTILNLINQGDVLFGASHLVLWKLLLTFVVPYFVATYGAVSYRLAELRRAGLQNRPMPPESGQRPIS